jgi:hypothetical protein
MFYDLERLSDVYLQKRGVWGEALSGHVICIQLLPLGLSSLRSQLEYGFILIRFTLRT